MILSLLNRLRRECGTAMPVAVGTMAVTATLASATFTVGLDSRRTSVGDRDAKRAAAAAQAALDLGFLRLTTARPWPNQCVTDVAVPAQGNGECPVYTEPADSVARLGNGATMSYVVSMQGASGCRTLPPSVDTRTAQEQAADRCITATGTVNGVKRRLQTRVMYLPAFRPWGGVGIVGDKKVEFGNNKQIHSPVGSNREVIAGNNTVIYGEVHLPLGPPPATFSGAGTHSGIVNPPQFVMPDIDFAPARAASVATLTPQLLSSIAASGATYDPAARTLDLPDNGMVLELPGGTYSFCNITMRQNSIIRVIPNTGVMKLWIDSPRDSGSGCAEGTGRLDLHNNAGINVPATGLPDPTLLELYVKGTTADGSALDVDFFNNNQFHGVIWAPFSTIDVKNNAAMSGGFTGSTVYFKNNGGFSHADSIKGKTIGGTGAVRRKGWFECTPEPTNAADHESGCQ